MIEIVERAEARALGYPEYFTGTPCRYGHIAPRDTETCVCVECEAENHVLQTCLFRHKTTTVVMAELQMQFRDPLDMELLTRRLDQFGTLKMEEAL